MLWSCEVEYIIYIEYSAKNIVDPDRERENPMKIELQED